MGASGKPRVIIVGGGFGGLTAAQALKDAPVDVTVLDKSNHHLFQPLLYQVAMAGLSPADIAAPIRSIVGAQDNTRVLLTTVEGVDLDHRVVRTSDGPMPYDFLVLAAGARTSYFGHDETWGPHALGLKSVDDALEIRRRVLMAFESAEKETDAARREALLTFVVIGGGPTGVELAGGLSELSRFVLDRDFQAIRGGHARVLLVEAGERLLPSMDPALSRNATAELRRLGVEVRTGARVTQLDETGVWLGTNKVASATIMWAAGVRASPLAEKLGVPLDRSGRVVVEKDCSIPGHPEVFVIGDMANFSHQTGQPLPGVSPVAMQQARYVARLIETAPQGETRQAFEYVDKGSMATIGRSAAVVEMGKLRLTGLTAWVAWLAVHIWYLIGFKNRIIVMLTWAWSYITYKRGARLITGGLQEVPSMAVQRKPQAAQGSTGVSAAPPG